MREQLNDDKALVILLRLWLPSYVGPAITLFRGENLDRLLCNHVGLCWTPVIETARMFAEGLNAVNSGGVLLRCDVDSTAIIAGPSAHSLYLNEMEYTVDPSLLTNVRVVEQYPTVA